MTASSSLCLTLSARRMLYRSVLWHESSDILDYAFISCYLQFPDENQRLVLRNARVQIYNLRFRVISWQAKLKNPETAAVHLIFRCFQYIIYICHFPFTVIYFCNREHQTCCRERYQEKSWGHKKSVCKCHIEDRKTVRGRWLCLSCLL